MEKRSERWSYVLREEFNMELRPHDYVRPYIWYVVLLNCPSVGKTEPEELEVTYTLHFVNQDGGEKEGYCPGENPPSGSVLQLPSSLMIVLLSLLSILLSSYLQ